jgi:hypothetical protein
MRVGQRDDLPGVGRIGEDLLVTGHGSVENYLTNAGTGCADTFAPENSTVGEG